MADTSNVRVLKAIGGGARTITAIVEKSGVHPHHAHVAVAQLQRGRLIRKVKGEIEITDHGKTDLGGDEPKAAPVASPPETKKKKSGLSFRRPRGGGE